MIAHSSSASPLSASDAHLVNKRYTRQMAIEGFGPDGQSRLHSARLLVVGAGGLGSPAALYLAGAGVGHLTLADDDRVSLSNLHRQILYTEANIGCRKAETARDTLSARNRHIDCQVLPHRLSGCILIDAVRNADIVLDCTDNFTARRALDAACIASSTPWIHASVSGMNGQITCFTPPFGNGCYRCLFPDSPARPTDPPSVLGPLPGILGAMQALEAIRLCVYGHSPLDTTMAVFDGHRHHWHYLERTPDPDCPICGDRT